MINDSVREELKPITASLVKPANFEKKGSTSIPNKLNQQTVVTGSAKAETAAKPNTGKLEIKPTNQTLVEFHNKNATVPEWRLQLQNAVRKRQNCSETEVAPVDVPFVPQTRLVTKGANALKAEIIKETEPVQFKNPTLKSALDRIEKSRQQFLSEEKNETAPSNPPAATNKNYPFYIASKQSETALPQPNVKASINPPVRPKLAASLRTDASKPLDTNKLPPLPQQAIISTSFVNQSIEAVEEIPGNTVDEIKETPINFVETVEHTENNIISEAAVEEVEEIEEIDDCAPFAMRFNAGLFDLIIGSFASLILLSPFMIRSEGWFTAGGFFAFLATCAVVMFAYMTIAIGFYGKTFGMRMFSLEVIDIDGETYPTMHQAAVSSSVYLLSLAFGGIGFLPLLFNEEKRAAHDLISKTIIVRDF